MSSDAPAHLRTFARIEDLEIHTFRIEQRVTFSTDGALGACESVETHVIVESPEPREKIEAWVKRSKQACMAMQSIGNATPQMMRLHLNGRDV